MDTLFLSSAVAFIACISIAIQLTRVNMQGQLKHMLVAFVSCLAIGVSGDIIPYLAFLIKINPPFVLTSLAIIYGFANFSAATLILTTLHLAEKKVSKPISMLVFFPSALHLIVSFTAPKQIIENITPAYDQGKFDIAYGPFFEIFSLYLVLSVFFALIYGAISIKRSAGIKKEKLKYFIAAMIFILIASIIFSLGIFEASGLRLDNVAIALFSGFLFFSVSRQEIFEIRAQTNRYLATIFTLIIFLTSYLVVDSYFQKYARIAFFLEATFLCFWITFGDQLRKLIQGKLDIIISTGLYSSDDSRGRLLFNLIYTLSRFNAFKALAEELQDTIGISRAFFVVLNDDDAQKSYELYESGSDKLLATIDDKFPAFEKINRDFPLPEFLLEEAFQEELQQIIPAKVTGIVPLTSLNELQGMVFLSAKKSKDDYSGKDTELIMSSHSILEMIVDRIVYQKRLEQTNTQLESMVQKAQLEIEKLKYIASLEGISQKLSHEINNPLQAISSAMSDLEEDLPSEDVYWDDHLDKLIDVDIKNRIEAQLNDLQVLNGYAFDPKATLFPFDLDSLLNEQKINQKDIVKRLIWNNYLTFRMKQVGKGASTNIRRIVKISKAMTEFLKHGVSRKEHIQVNDLLRDVSETIEGQCRNLNIGFHFEGPEEDVFLNANYALIQTLLSTLCKNSIEAIVGSSDEDKAFQIKIGTAKENKTFIIYIEDNGPGIPDAIQPRIFEDTFTTKDKLSGDNNGIGLPLAKSMVEEHGGQITFYSKENEITRFSISLPMAVVKDRHDSSDQR